MNLKIGQKAFQTKKFSKDEVAAFSRLTADDNPIHFDEKYASKTRFRNIIVQGPMVAGLIGGVLGSKLPGPGTIYMSQETRFLKPLYIDETVKVWIEVVNVRSDKPIITFKNWIEKEDGGIVLTGQSVVLYLDELDCSF